MNDPLPIATGMLDITHETLRDFAKGRLDERTEQKVLALLEADPELAAQVAAISADSVIAKMRSHSKLVSNRSLSSQLSAGGLGSTELSSSRSEDPSAPTSQV